MVPLQVVALEVQAALDFFKRLAALAGKPIHECKAQNRAVAALGVERDGTLSAACLLASPAYVGPAEIDPQGLEVADVAIEGATHEEHKEVWALFQERAIGVAQLRGLSRVYMPITKPDNIFNVQEPPPDRNPVCLAHGVTNCHLCRGLNPAFS